MVQVEISPPLPEAPNPRVSESTRWAFLWVDSARDLEVAEYLRADSGIPESWARASHHLSVLAESLMDFTPQLSLRSDGIWLEIGKSAHLFGGEESTLHKALLRAQALGFRGGAVVADRPDTALILSKTLAKIEEQGALSPYLVPRGGDARTLASLPVSVLEPSDSALQLFEQLGIADLGQLGKISPASLRCRIGVEGERLVQRARADSGISPPRYIPQKQPLVELEFEPPLCGYEPLLFVSKRLLDDLVAVAAARGMAIDAFRILIEPVSGKPLCAELPLARPCQSAPTLLSIVREFLNQAGIDLGALGILRIAFQTLSMVQQSEEQGSLFERGTQVPARGAELLIRLESFLGAGAVYGAALRSSYRPEDSWRPTTFSLEEAPRVAHIEEEERPIFLFAAPYVLAGELRCGAVLCWSEGSGVVREIWGPERLRASWWEEPLVRDYYVVELNDGSRLWVFRELETQKLFLHGLFD